MTALAEIKEAADLSEAKTDIALGKLPQRDAQVVESEAQTHSDWLDIGGELIAVFKLTVLETRKTDDVEGIANAWQALTEMYGRVLANFEASLNAYRINHENFVPGTLRRTEHVIERLKLLQERAQELYALHA